MRKRSKFVLVEQTLVDKELLLIQAPGMPDLVLPLNLRKDDGDHIADVTYYNFHFIRIVILKAINGTSVKANSESNLLSNMIIFKRFFHMLCILYAQEMLLYIIIPLSARIFMEIGR